MEENAADSFFCIHPDAQEKGFSATQLRENIYSKACSVCKLCGGKCRGEVGNKLILSEHHVAHGAVYCPGTMTAYALSKLESGEICQCGRFTIEGDNNPSVRESYVSKNTKASVEAFQGEGIA